MVKRRDRTEVGDRIPLWTNVELAQLIPAISETWSRGLKSDPKCLPEIKNGSRARYD